MANKFIPSPGGTTVPNALEYARLRKDEEAKSPVSPKPPGRMMAEVASIKSNLTLATEGKS
jgi:hypothetical protein